MTKVRYASGAVQCDLCMLLSLSVCVCACDFVATCYGTSILSLLFCSGFSFSKSNNHSIRSLIFSLE